MIKKIIETGKSVEEAVATGCQKLGVTVDRVDFEILEMPKRGFLGLKNTAAKVEITYTVSRLETAVDYLKSILQAMGVADAEVETSESGNEALLTLRGDDTGFIIGRRGETLDALQYLTSLVANRAEGEYYRVTLDCSNYRDKREKALEGLAKKVASTVVKTGRSVTLEPMNPYERRIIHAAVQTVKGATSSSVGEEPYRKVVIYSTSPQKAVREKRDFQGKGGPGRNYGKPRYRGEKPAAGQGDGRPQEPAKPVPASKSTHPLEAADDRPLYSKIDLNSDSNN